MEHLHRILSTLLTGRELLLFLAVSYWWIDVKDHKKHLLFFLVFGMNSIFIYLFFEIVASRWFNGYILTITNSLFGFIHFPEVPAEIIGSLIIFALEAGMMYFLYRKKVFFKL